MFTFRKSQFLPRSLVDQIGSDAGLSVLLVDPGVGRVRTTAGWTAKTVAIWRTGEMVGNHDAVRDSAHTLVTVIFSNSDTHTNLLLSQLCCPIILLNRSHFGVKAGAAPASRWHTCSWCQCAGAFGVHGAADSSELSFGDQDARSLVSLQRQESGGCKDCRVHRKLLNMGRRSCTRMSG